MILNKVVKILILVLFLIKLGLTTQGQTLISNKPSATIIKVPQSTSPSALNPIPGAYSSSVQTNYVRTREAVAPITDEAILDGEGYLQVKQTTQYLDGLSRPFQTVMRQATPGDNPTDLISPVTYDDFDREAFKYLPYVKTTGSNSGDGSLKLDPFNEQDNFYKNVYKDGNNNLMLDGERYLYSQTVFEPSPLNRVTQSLAPGNSWVGSNKYVGQQYLTNNANDSVQIWTITNNTLNFDDGNQDNINIPTTSTSSTYGVGSLYKTIVTDENGNSVVEYKDKDGLVILKKVQNGTIPTDYSGYTNWLCTYYIYDDLNRLRFVIPPKAVEYLTGHSWTLSSTDVINELCFRYEYDTRQRMIGKKVPGTGWMAMLYDQRDRLAFTQDANMRLQHQFLAIIYDDLNRPISTGMLTYSPGITSLQLYLNSGSYFNGFILNTTVTTPSTTAPIIVIKTRLPTLFYHASEGITFEPGFESELGANITAEIVPALPGSSYTQTVPLTVSPFPSGYPYIELTSTYYDNYSNIGNISSHSYTSNLNSKLSDVGANSNPDDMLSQSDQANVAVRGMVTGSRVRVIEDPGNLSSGSWLTSVIYYDQKGRAIQTQSDNYSGGTDIAINHYDFTGKVLNNYLVQNDPHSAVPVVKVKTDMVYDHTQRLITVYKTINDDDAKKALIATNTYDEMGQLKKKLLGQKRDANGDYTSTEIESLNYNYNIRGWLKGINAAYSHPELTSGISPDHWFGMELNYDWGSETNKNQLNGNISSTTWKSKGDGVRRAYGFSYDAANRILGADFSENTSGSYAHSAVDFSMVMGTDTKPAYDANGNINGMKQWGVKLTGSTPIDQLTYSYYPNTNKLQAVTEDPSTSSDNKLGDFTDKNTGTTDYGYDLNGNLITDLNKQIGALSATGLHPTAAGGIIYNHLNLPYSITIPGKGTITYKYDAAGNKLEKSVHEFANTANNIPAKDVVTSYIGSTVYEQNILQFISHEEGRTRFDPASSSIIYNNDFFIKDHLGNVRTVLTDEVSPAVVYQATMEDATNNLEASEFGTDKMANLPFKPSGFDNDNNNKKVAVVNGSSPDSRIGPGIVLKVMAGDKISANTYAWYQPVVNGTTVDQDPATLGTSLLSQFTTGVEAAGKAVTNNTDLNFVSAALTIFMGSHANSSSLPKAYLNWILLDEEKLAKVDDNNNSNAVQVPIISSGGAKMAVVANGGSDIEISKNGYIYIYVSNESRQNVYFDDLTIHHTKGPLLEETHYYPFGLSMTGISSKAVGNIENRRGFNGIEHTTDLDLNQYDAFFRTLDPQTGRFWQIDPNPNTSISPFTAMENNPIFNIDPLGDTIIISDAVKNNSAALAAVNFFKKSDTFQKLFGQYDTGGEGSFFGGKEGSQSGNNFVFDVIDNPAAGGNTKVEVQDADGNWQKVNDGARFNTSNMSSDSKTRITVAVDFNTHNSPEGYANTFNHEATAHAAPYEKTLNVLREQGPVEFKRENSLSTSYGYSDIGKGLLGRGYNISNVQHGRAAVGDNLEYNAIRKEIRQQLSPTQQKNYDKVANNLLHKYQSFIPAYRVFVPH